MSFGRSVGRSETASVGSHRVLQEGMLDIRGRLIGKWKPRFVRLHPQKLVIFPDELAEMPLFTIALDNSSCRPAADSSRHPFSFTVTQSTPRKKAFVLQATDTEELQAWLDVLEPFCVMLPPQTDEEESQLDRSLRAFEYALKARPVDTTQIQSSLAEMLELMRNWEKEEPFSRSVALEDPEFDAFLTVVKKMSSDAYATLAKAPVQAISVSHGEVMFHNAQYTYQKFLKLRKLGPMMREHAAITLLQAWKDAMDGYQVAQRLPAFIDCFTLICVDVARRSRYIDPEAAALAKMFADELPKLRAALAVLQKAQFFGYLSMNGQGFFGGWRRRFFVAENGMLSWYEQPGANTAMSSIPFKQIKKVGPGTHPKRPHSLLIHIRTERDPIEVDPGYTNGRIFWIDELTRLSKTL